MHVKFCAASLLYLFLLVASFAGTENSDLFCPLKSDSNSSTVEQEVRFTEKHGPATLAIACKYQKVYMLCCMTGFSRIEWRQWISDTRTWVDFSSVGESRKLSEDNQVASLDSPSFNDSGHYKCIGYSNRNEISNQVHLQVQECDNYCNQPQLLEPRDKLGAVQEADLHESFNITCSAFFGKCSFLCDIGWLRLGSWPDFEAIRQNSTERIYSLNLKNGQNTLMSKLVIQNVSESDYGVYQCWMTNQYGSLNVNVTLVRTKEPFIEGAIFTSLTAACSAVALLAIILLTVGVRKRHNIRLWFRERHRTEPSTEGLEYDICLMYAKETASFGRFICDRLSTSWKSYKHYRVYNLSESLGGSVFTDVGKVIGKSRCALVIVCPKFIQQAQEELNRYNLLHLLPQFESVVYILNGVSQQQLSTSVTDPRLTLYEAIKASILNGGRTVVWPSPQANQPQQQTRQQQATSSHYERLVSSNSTPDDGCALTDPLAGTQQLQHQRQQAAGDAAEADCSGSIPRDESKQDVHDGTSTTEAVTSLLEEEQADASEAKNAINDREFWEQVERENSGAVNKFWLHLRLAVPNRKLDSCSQIA